MADDAAPLRHLFLIDGSGFIFRAFHALPPMTRPDGTPVNAVFGFTAMLLKLLDSTDADAIAVVFDAARATFRNTLYPAYKANRGEPPEALIPQFALVREATRACNVAAVESEGFEADDLIATYARLAREAEVEVTIVSSDKDLMQLIRPGVGMLDAVKNRPIGEAEVREKFGVAPDRVVDVQALAGDATDNVPGVPGIGVKTAAQLIETYGDLDTLLARAAEIAQPKRRAALLENADAARLSRELVRLRDDVPAPLPLDDFRVKPPDHDALLAFLEAHAFRALIQRIAAKGRAAMPAAAAKSSGGDLFPEAVVAGPGGERPLYTLIQDEATLQAWIDRASAKGAVAVDTETTSLDPMRARLVGLSLALAPGQAAYVPIGHVTEGAQIERGRALALLAPLLADPAVLKIGQNIKYDIKVLAQAGLAVTPVDDTMLMSYVLEGGIGGHGMDELAERHLGWRTITYGEVCGTGKSQVTFDQVPLDKALAYAAEDADVTFRLHALLKPRLLAEKLMTVYETLERPLVPVLTAMEKAGIAVDRDTLAALSIDFAARIAELETEIHRLAGRPFNVASPKQLGEVLFDEMNLGEGRKGKTGAYGTGADVLDALAAEGHPLPARVLDFRQLSKLKSTYTDALIEQIDPGTGRVHTSYQQAVASTGRLSSADPNLQNIPVRSEEGRRIRRAFIAPKGHVLLSADYSQIELRLLAHVAGIGALKDAFAAGQDIHAITAAQVFGVPVEGMDPLVRRKAKAINFGIIYGISPFGLARQLGIGRGEAAAYIDAYFERYPGIRDYMERTKAEARERGFVTTLFGRRCHLRGINDKNPSVRSFAERAAINAPIQGGAADIIKRAMIRLAPALARAGLAARMLLQVHDELIFEVPEGEAEASAALIRHEMASVARLTVPLVVDVGWAGNWADAH